MKRYLAVLLIASNLQAQVPIQVLPPPMFGPALETPSILGIIIQQAPPIINLNTLVAPLPPSPVCNLFDIWGESGRCNKFPSHVEAEQHYEASLFTIKELQSQLDDCKNDLVECKNDSSLPPLPVATPISPSVSGVVGCDVIANATEKRFIYKQSAPLRASGIGTPILGFRKEPTLIMNTDISNKGTIFILDSEGSIISRCPWATAKGHAGGRARCQVSTSSVRQAAIKNTNSPSIFFKVNQELCVKVEDAGRCVNSVKGLCNGLIE